MHRPQPNSHLGFQELLESRDRAPLQKYKRTSYIARSVTSKKDIYLNNSIGQFPCVSNGQVTG